MVLTNIMKITVKILMLLTLTFCFSCEEQGFSIKCSDCTTREPLDASLEIKIDASIAGYNTIIKIYEGNLEDSILYSSRQSNPNYFVVVPVALNKKYTVTATYHIGTNYYTAVDAATPRIKFDKNQCDDPCYFIYDKDIDLRLKYTK
jgi:hypothetical protein